MRIFFLLLAILSLPAQDTRVSWYNPDEETAALGKEWGADKSYMKGQICPLLLKDDQWKIGFIGQPSAGWDNEVREIVDDKPGKESAMVLRFWDHNGDGEQFIFIKGIPTAGVVDGARIGSVIIKVTGTKKHNGRTMWEGVALGQQVSVSVPEKPAPPKKQK